MRSAGQVEEGRAMRLAGDGRRPRWAAVVAALAGLFGAATVVSGWRVLFGGEAARAAAGHYVPFVLWFNFLAGFAYLGAAAGVALGRRWAGALAAAIAAATLVVGLAFAAHVLTGGAFEPRTVAAMALRLGIWTTIAVLLHRRPAWARPGAPGG